MGIVKGERRETYKLFCEFLIKHDILKKIDLPTNFLWSDQDKGLDEELPVHFKQMIHCFCNHHYANFLCREFPGAQFNRNLFLSLCKSVTQDQVTNAMDSIRAKSEKVADKLMAKGLERFVLFNIQQKNPNAWTAGSSNSNAIEHVFAYMLDNGEIDGRGGECPSLRNYIFPHAITKMLWYYCSFARRGSTLICHCDK